jgi:hypothetical protein
VTSLPALETVAWLFDHLSSLPREAIACLGRVDIDGADPCLIFDGDELDPDHDVPPDAESRGLLVSIGIPDVQSIVRVLERQTSNPTLAQRVEALSHYLQHDAYMPPLNRG